MNVVSWTYHRLRDLPRTCIGLDIGTNALTGVLYIYHCVSAKEKLRDCKGKMNEGIKIEKRQSIATRMGT